MAFWMEDDIDAMLEGLGGVSVVHGSETGQGLLDVHDEELLRNGQDPGLIGKVVSVLVKTASFPTLAMDDLVIVDGKQYSVRDRLRIDDGAMTRLLLREV